MTTIALNGQRVTAAHVSLPTFGPWTADVTIATTTVIPDAITLVVGDLTLKGHTRRKATFAGSQTARLVGGSGGWRKTIKSRGYSHPAGVRMSSVLKDAASECGESMGPIMERVLGPLWVRDKSKASRVLKVLTGGQWWIDPKGVTQIGARDGSKIATPFTLVKWIGGFGQFEIATEAIASWQPGRTFEAPTAKGPHTISSVSITADNEGKLRILVLTEDTERDRLKADLREIVRDELAEVFCAGLWSYTIVAATSSTIDAVPDSDRVPALKKCPMYPGLLGEEVTPAPGSTCLVGFINLDRAKPVCLHIDGHPAIATVHALSFLLGSRPVAALGDFAGPFPVTATGVGG